MARLTKLKDIKRADRRSKRVAKVGNKKQKYKASIKKVQIQKRISVNPEQMLSGLAMELKSEAEKGGVGSSSFSEKHTEVKTEEVLMSDILKRPISDLEKNNSNESKSNEGQDSKNQAKLEIRPENQSLCSVAFLGAPNTGKSTLLNTILGSRVSIVSHRPQTTQTNIKGIFTKENVQIVFTDTPGMISKQKKSHIRLRDVALKATKNKIDESVPMVVCVFVQASIGESPTSQSIIKELIRQKSKFVIIISKIDIAKESKILSLGKDLYDKYQSHLIDMFFISSFKGRGVDKMVKFLLSQAKPHDWIFGHEAKTDTEIGVFCAEITREKILKFIKQEIPYSVSVKTTGIVFTDENKLNVAQVIECLNQNHKLILIGKKKEMLERILATSQETISESIGVPVNLFLDIVLKK